MLRDQGSVEAQQNGSKLLEDARTEAEQLATTNLSFAPHAHEEVVSLLAEVIGEPDAGPAGSKQANSVQNAGTSATGTTEQASAQSDNAQNIEIPAEALPVVLEAVSQLSTVYAYDTQRPTRTEPSQKIQRRLQNSRTVMYLRSSLEEQRLVANDMVNQFVAEFPGRAQSLAMLGQTIPARIQPVTDAATSNVVATVEAQTAILTTHTAQVRAQAKNNAQIARKRIRQRHGASVAADRASTAIARQQIETGYNAGLNVLNEQETALLQRIEDLYVKADTEIRATGRQVGDEALAIGERKAQEYLSQRINRDDNIWDGPLTDNRCEASRQSCESGGRSIQE